MRPAAFFPSELRYHGVAGRTTAPGSVKRRNMSGTNDGMTEWLRWPFAEQVFAVSLLACLAPGIAGVWLISNRNALVGLSALLFWLFPYAILLRWLHRRGAVRFAISLPGSALVLLATLFVK